jgi:hypothetical protein
VRRGCPALLASPRVSCSATQLRIEVKLPCVGVLTALNKHIERVFYKSRKDTRWGKRKLARDR